MPRTGRICPILRTVKPVVHVVGARPNFMKAAPVIRALKARHREQLVVHTGQHYDKSLSDVFFSELDLPQPDINLGVGSGTQSGQTAALILALEAAFQSVVPALTVVYGDVNSTLAAALVAAKLRIPVAHVEAGLRSFDNAMPEEINRRVTDVLSDLLLVTAPEGLVNLKTEGISDERVHFVGNPMIDTLVANRHRFDPGPPKSRHGLGEDYAVVTIHRPSNVDEPTAAARIVRMLDAVAARLQVVLPLHPRGRQSLADAGLRSTDRLVLLEPLGYLEFMSLVTGAKVVITDSGGIQEETTTIGIPCLTVRRNTERPITITHGTNRLVEPEEVAGAVDEALTGRWQAPSESPPLWDGHAGERIAEIIVGLRDRAAS